MPNSLLTDGYATNKKGENIMEKWKTIPGYEGLYEASDMGNIRSVEGKITSSARFPHRVWKGRVMKQKVQRRKNRSDARVELWKAKEHKTHLVSRLVASAWLGEPLENMTVNHINGNTLDNSAANLEWVTLSDNIKKGFETGLFSTTQKKVRLRTHNEIVCFQSYADASRFLGRSVGYVSLCIVNGRQPTSKSGTRYEVF